MFGRKIVRGLYITLVAVSANLLCLALLFGFLLPLPAMFLWLIGAPDDWLGWFVENVVLWAFGVGVAGLLIAWAAPKLLNVFTRGVVWLNREVRDVSQ